MTDVYTSGYAYRGADRLDITRAGCDRLIAHDKDAPGVILAPSARLVFPTLRRMKAARTEAEREAIWQEYRVAYINEIGINFERWPFMLDALLWLPRFTMCCFCRDVRRCHRSLAAEILVERGAVYRGEVKP